MKRPWLVWVGWLLAALLGTFCGWLLAQAFPAEPEPTIIVVPPGSTSV